MEEKSGCLNWAGLIAVIIGLYIWVNNVQTVQVTQQLPPPQESWDVVYPKFRDDVSAQLLNTQKIAGSVLNETAYLKKQNSDLQNSVDLLLSNLGILKKESYQESIRQRNEQRITTVLSVIFGWLLGAFVTKDSLAQIRKTLSQRKKKDVTKSQTPNTKEEINNIPKDSLLKRIQEASGSEVQHHALIQKLPQAAQPPSTKLCPTCGMEMELQLATTGKFKGKQFFVCSNYKQCKQVFPAS